MKPIMKSRDMLRVVSGELPPPPCNQTLQLEVRIAENGMAKAIWTVDERLLNAAGVAMGGFITSAADITMAFALASVLDEDEIHTSIDINTTFHRPVMTGTAYVEARVERRGRNTAYLTCDVVQNEKKAASATSSIFIRKQADAM